MGGLLVAQAALLCWLEELLYAGEARGLSHEAPLQLRLWLLFSREVPHEARDKLVSPPDNSVHCMPLRPGASGRLLTALPCLPAVPALLALQATTSR